MCPNITESFEHFWGKARGGCPPTHPLWMHSLDVAAVGRELADLRPRLFGRVAERLGWSIEELRDLWVFLLALHDIGKFSQHFQAKAPDFWPVAALGPLANAPRLVGADPGHPAAAAALFFAPRTRRPDHIKKRLAAWFPSWGEGEEDALPLLLAPIIGHHGRPVALPYTPIQDLFWPEAEAAALAFADAAHALLRPPSLREPSEPAVRYASWPLAGLTVLCDWIGSNRGWFPYTPNGPTLTAYWTEIARPQARNALSQAGLAPSPPSLTTGFHALTKTAYEPSPIQSWAEVVTLPEGPLLILIEDMTGGGKTEAALVLAHRLMAADRAAGIYFALPTMATANAMFDRIQEAASRLYAEGVKASLALAHGRADLHPSFRPMALEGRQTIDGPESPEDSREPDSAVAGAAWLASETRKALLADLGVGTIDQALLAVLPAKYQAARLAGLAEKVLVVDEAHSYDAYMGAELDRLVAFHAALGGNTIILSATLPRATKSRIAEAWRRILKAQPIALVGDAYPAVTLLGPSVPSLEQPQSPRFDLPRVLTVTRVPHAEAAVGRIADAATVGAAVAWIRNTVQDVIAGAALLSAHGIEAQIFHARFAMSDRLAIESDVLRRFGPSPDAGSMRHGRVVVASQVIEQSLDVDFDLLISDLAPIDLLLQRAGRLWRHPWRNRLIQGPELVVVSPDPEGDVDADWYLNAFPLGASVYSHHLLVWRSARELFRSGRVRIPEDVRGLVEAVYGEGLEQGAPEALRERTNRALGKMSAERAYAEHNLLKIEEGYASDGTVWPKEHKVETRLGEETRTLRLARVEAGLLHPWHDDLDLKRAWAMSEVSVRQVILKGAHHPSPKFAEAVRSARIGWGPFEEQTILLPLELGTNEVWRGVLAADGGRTFAAQYDSRGLQFEEAAIRETIPLQNAEMNRQLPKVGSVGS